MLNSIRPDLPECAASIPAMTSEAERLAYYRLTLDAAPKGAVIELGAWLGASTAYIAAGMRDSTGGRAYVYDRFRWDPSHVAKGAKSHDMIGQFTANLGPLLDHVAVHPGEIVDMVWDDEPTSLIVLDAPKRIPEISSVLTTFAGAVQPGTVMAWQDFAYFPSYDIPAALMRLGDKLEFVEGVYPGSTAVFRVTQPWTRDEVSRETLDLKAWSADEIEWQWDHFLMRLPKKMRSRFMCGAACFLADNGHVKRAKEWLRPIVEDHAEEVMPKWRLLLEQRRDLVARWRPLFEMLDKKMRLAA